MTRVDGGRAFFAALFAGFLASWYPLQETYVDASRGLSIGVAVALASVTAGVLWGAGGPIDALIVAAASALGAASALAIGVALVADLARQTSFYASSLGATELSSRLWVEAAAAVAGGGLGGLVGSFGSKLSTEATPAPRLPQRAARLGLACAGLALLLSVGLVAVSLPLVLARTTIDGPSASIDPGVVRFVVLAISVVAAGSATLSTVTSGGQPRFRLSVLRALAAPVLAGLAFVAAGVYESFVVNPF